MSETMNYRTVSADEMRRIIEKQLKSERLSPKVREELTECYVQQNTIETTAYKLQLPVLETRLLYYRMTMALMKEAFDSYRS